MILSSDKSSERNFSCFFDIINPRRMEHLQSKEPFSSDPYFRIYINKKSDCFLITDFVSIIVFLWYHWMLGTYIQFLLLSYFFTIHGSLVMLKRKSIEEFMKQKKDWDCQKHVQNKRNFIWERFTIRFFYEIDWLIIWVLFMTILWPFGKTDQIYKMATKVWIL